MFGLPLHPLVVHLVVVALPVGALGVAAAVIWPTVRSRYGILALIVLTLGALTAIAARFTGVVLAEQETLPETHAAFGTALMIVSLIAAGLSWAWWLLERRRDAAPPGSSPLAAMVSGAFTVTVAIAVVGLTVATGHSGADAVWGSGRRPAPAVTTAAAPTYTLAQVAEHNSASDCWAAVDGKVYDLTGWVGRHPGGAQRILNLCGTDATVAFTTQHSDKARPNAQLASMQVGELAA